MPKVKKLTPKVETRVRSVQQIVIPDGAAQLVQMAPVANGSIVKHPSATVVNNMITTNGICIPNGLRAANGVSAHVQQNGTSVSTNGIVSTNKMESNANKRPFQIAQITSPNNVIKSPLLSSQIFTASVSTGNNGVVNPTNGSTTPIQPTILKSKNNQSQESHQVQSTPTTTPQTVQSMPSNNSSNNLKTLSINSRNSIGSSEDQFSDFTLLAAAAVNSANKANTAHTTTTTTNNSFDTATFHTPNKRRKQEPKNGKGLRHFSMKVCEKVKLKGVTTYNEVADELVAEFTADPAQINHSSSGDSFQNGEAEPFDQKNIRRRVYDALNVLMAMNIISKERKEIRWQGLPSNSTQECFDLEQEKQDRLERIRLKKQQLRDLLLEQIAFKNLVERNKRFSQTPSPNAIIKLPFIIVTTDKKTVIDCSISNDKSEYLFNFDNAFEIHDDTEILKRIGFACGLEKSAGSSELNRRELEKARSQLPDGLRSELDAMLEEKQQQQSPLPPLPTSQQQQKLLSRPLQMSSSATSELIINSELDSSSFFSMQSTQ